MFATEYVNCVLNFDIDAITRQLLKFLNFKENPNYHMQIKTKIVFQNIQSQNIFCLKQVL